MCKAEPLCFWASCSFTWFYSFFTRILFFVSIFVVLTHVQLSNIIIHNVLYMAFFTIAILSVFWNFIFQISSANGLILLISDFFIHLIVSHATTCSSFCLCNDSVLFVFIIYLSKQPCASIIIAHTCTYPFLLDDKNRKLFLSRVSNRNAASKYGVMRLSDNEWVLQMIVWLNCLH